jgi:hypothetical protein
MTVTRRRAWPRSGTSQLVGVVAVAGSHEVGGATGCAPRLVRWRARSHTPPREATLMGRVRTCTTALRRVRANRSETDAGTRLARGNARSSGQTVAALGATRLQHSTAATSGHASPKAVLLRPLQVVRLVGALHTSLLGSAAHRLRNSGHQGAQGDRPRDRQGLRHNFTRLRVGASRWQPAPTLHATRPDNACSGWVLARA